MLVVAKILGHRQRCMTDAKAGAGRLVHLAEYHHHILQHTRGFHVAIEFFAFATAFADAAKNADAFVLAHHVVNHLGEQYRLADARTAKQARFAAALQRHEHIDRLDARLEDVGLGGASRQGGWGPVDAAPLHVRRRRLAVDGGAEDVEHARQNRLADRRLQWPSAVLHPHAARQPLGGRQRDAPHMTRIPLGQYFDNDLIVRAGAQDGIDGR